jgi:folate-binding protein YgfZ
MTTRDGYTALREDAGWIERHDAGRLRLRGADRRSYLHGLLTNDIESLLPGSGTYAALLTAQGRMITDMHVYELGDALLVTVPRTIAAGIRDRFDQFIFSEDVEVEDITESTVQIGVYGPSSAKAVDAIRIAGLGVDVMPSREFGIEGFEIIGPLDAIERLASILNEAGATAVGIESLETVRVESGVPRFLADMTETTIPLEAGIEDRAISMTKGCYPGQEVIVRVLHRGGGRVARKLVGIVLGPEAELPPDHARVFSNDREIGTLTSVVSSRLLARPLALGYLHRDFTAPGTNVEVETAGDQRMPAIVQLLPISPPTAKSM